MNDFFSHLVARSFDLAEGIELVRPRLPALFEPLLEKAQVQNLGETAPGPGRNAVSEDIRGDSPPVTDGASSAEHAPTPERQRERSERPGESDRVVAAPVWTESPGDREPVALRQKSPQLSSSVSPALSEPPERSAVEPKPPPVPARTAVIPGKAEPAEAAGEPMERTEQPREQANVRRVAGEKLQVHRGRTLESLTAELWRARTQWKQPLMPPDTYQPIGVLFDTGKEMALRKAVSELEPAKAPGLLEETEPTKRIEPMGDPGLTSPENTSGKGRPAVTPPVVQPIGAVFDSRKTTVLRKQAPRPEPTINVTIGRVEVRGAVPAKVERRKTRSSAMSLNDYLSGRKGGR